MKKTLLLLVLGLFCTQYLFAKTLAGTTTNWHTAGNRNPVCVPTTANDVEINTTTDIPLISTTVFVVPFIYLNPPTRRYVKATASGTGDGTSWANASNDIQAMINACANGDSVWIASGVYIPLYDGTGNVSPSNVRHKIFYMKSGVKLYGGFAGTETTLNQRDFKTNKTVFSGDADNNDTNTDGNFISESYTDIQGDNSYHILAILDCNNNTAIDGIIFTGGKGDAASGTVPVGTSNALINTGAAISVDGSSPTIRNCVFIGNDGYFGITCNNNNTITNPTDTVKISNSYYLNNRADYGGGIFLRRGSTLVDNVVFFNNTANRGGAIYIHNNMSASSLSKFTNMSIINNYSTFTKSVSISSGDIKFINTIIWNETPYAGGNIYKSGGTLTSSYSILQNSGAGGTWNDNYGTDGGNNYDADPLFTNTLDIDGADNKLFTNDDGLTLTGCSPGFNTGTNTDVFATDITNSPRPYNSGIADIGAYERQSTLTLMDDPINVSVNKTLVCPGNTIILSAQCSAGTITWYNQATGGTAIGTGNNLNQSPDTNIVYYSACEAGNCKSERIATVEITVATVSSNISLTASISGTAIYAYSNTITATNKVLSTANAQYLANNSISLNAGFETSSGAVFVAKATPITACN
jgi:predicted outer membrane repeat protein